MSDNIFTQERRDILSPVKTHWNRLIKEKEQHQNLLRASEVMLNAEEPSIRTYFCAKSVVLDYLRLHPNDPEAFKELGKVHLFSCGGEETLGLAQEALEQSQVLAGNRDPEIWYLLATCHQIRLLDAHSTPSSLRSELMSRAEHFLKLALRCSPPTTHAYRFALAEFYLINRQFSNSLCTLIDGFSPSANLLADAEVYHQLGTFGIACADTLATKGRWAHAHEFASRALQHFERGLEIHPDAESQWTDDLKEAQQRMKSWQDLRDEKHDAEPADSAIDTGPAPTCGASSVSTSREGLLKDKRKTSEEPGSPFHASGDESLSQLLRQVENQAVTYGDGKESDRVFGSGWAHADTDHRMNRSSLYYSFSGIQTLVSSCPANHDAISTHTLLSEKNLESYQAIDQESSWVRSPAEQSGRGPEHNSVFALTPVPQLSSTSGHSSEDVMGLPQTPNKSRVFGASAPIKFDQQRNTSRTQRNPTFAAGEQTSCLAAGEQLVRVQRSSSCMLRKRNRPQSLLPSLSPLATSSSFAEWPMSNRVLIPSAEEPFGGDQDTGKKKQGDGLSNDFQVLKNYMRRLRVGVDRPQEI